MLTSIIFDFDGVIFESVKAKTKAFRKLFKQYPKYVEKIVQLHMESGGMSRYEKFKIIYRDFLKLELTEAKSQELGRQFTEYSYDSVVNSVYVRGAHEFLEKYYKQLLLFVASGTPEEEMISIVRERGLDQYFNGVYGSPRSKAILITEILSKQKIGSDQTIFVGDSINDYMGADQTGVKFVGRIHPGYPNPFKDVHVDGLVNDLTELEELMKKKGWLL